MTIDVYNFPPSLWAAVPRLIIEETGIQRDIRYINTDLTKAENFSPEFLRLNPNHTIPVIVDQQTKATKTDSISVAKYLDDKTGNTLTPSDKAQADQMTRLIDLLHGPHDVGNALFFTAGSDQESDAKRELVVPFLKARIAGWQGYMVGASDLDSKLQLDELYSQQIKEAEQLIACYDKGNTQGATAMYEKNRQLTKLAVELLDQLDTVLKENGSDYLVGNKYTLADVHATPVLARLVKIKGEQAVLGDRDYLKAYYELVKARDNFKTI